MRLGAALATPLPFPFAMPLVPTAGEGSSTTAGGCYCGHNYPAYVASWEDGYGGWRSGAA